MKKILASILAILYLSTSMGMTVHIHYCMDKLVAVNLWHNDEKDACSKCGMPKNKGCCKDVHKEIKTDKAKKNDASFYSAKIITGTALLPAAPVYIVHPPSFPGKYPASLIHGPPGLDTVPLFIQNCVFRI